MSNYPPGVTGNEPEIAGVEHYRDCPLSDEFDVGGEGIDPGDVLVLVRAVDEFLPWANAREGSSLKGQHETELRRALRPFRGLLNCVCDDIRQAQAEDAAGV